MRHLKLLMRITGKLRYLKHVDKHYDALYFSEDKYSCLLLKRMEILTIVYEGKFSMSRGLQVGPQIR